MCVGILVSRDMACDGVYERRGERGSGCWTMLLVFR
jgi:hypothetical protein